MLLMALAVLALGSLLSYQGLDWADKFGSAASLVIGVIALYGTLLAINLVGAFLLVPRQSLADALGHKASVASMAELAWLATSVATVGGALGAGLETDEAVREAAYGYQADAELSR